MNIWLLGLISFFTDVSSEMVYPLIPLFLTARLGASPAVLGLIEGTVESISALLKVTSGRYSDRRGRRKPLALGGYTLSFLGKALLYLAGSWQTVFVARGLDRAGKGVRGAPRDALIAESAEPGKLGAAFGLHRLMDTLGAVVGVTLAYLFMRAAPQEYTRVFLWSLVPAALALLCFVPIKDVAQTRIAFARTALAPLAQLPADIKRFLVVALLFSLGNSSNHFLVLRAFTIGYLPASVILLYLVYNLSYAAISYSAGRLSDRVGRKPLLLTAYLLYALVYAGFALVNRPGVMWMLFATYGLYVGISEGVEKALLMDLSAGLGKATTIGWHGTLVSLTLLPASLIAGLLWKYVSPAAPFVFGSAMAAIAAVMLYSTVREQEAPAG
ncbi:MAG: Multidrug resistance protein MdtH [Firmicutes bacterium]|nr:Multidrug resistance protein MdtH [Bacillota bacterium]